MGGILTPAPLPIRPDHRISAKNEAVVTQIEGVAALLAGGHGLRRRGGSDQRLLRRLAFADGGLPQDLCRAREDGFPFGTQGQRGRRDPAGAWMNRWTGIKHDGAEAGLAMRAGWRNKRG